MSYLLDTCVISRLRKIRYQSDPKLEKWLSKHHEESFFISSMTVGEIQSGISKLSTKNGSDNQKRMVLENWFFEELLPRFHNRIIPINTEVAITWGQLYGSSSQRGITIPLADGLIAATALVHNLTLATDNTKDFLETGARLFNPWID